MPFTLTNSLIRVFFASLRNIAYICYSTIKDTLAGQHSLPLEVRQNLTAAQRCTMHINRLTNIFDHLLESKSFDVRSYDPMQVLDELSGSFRSTVSEYANVSVKVYSKMKYPLPLATNKELLELILLNILYASMRNANDLNMKNIKYDFYLTTKGDDIVMHIRDNCEPIDPKIIESVFTHRFEHPQVHSPYSSVIKLSLDLAKISLAELDGCLEYRPLKKGNRFDIFLPMVPRQGAQKSMLCEPRFYSTDRYCITRIFGDLSPDFDNREFIVVEA